ncbi:MAG: replicative DNA helicase [Saprospiraceae bacterium]
MSDKPSPRIGSSADLKRRSSKVDPSLAYGKVQPQALDVEEVVLGAIMLDKDAISVVLDILQPDSFYSEGHQAIYRCMLALFDNNTAIDLITVNDQLRKTGELDKAGGPYRLVQLSNRVGSAANVEYHARIIAQKSIARELIKVSSEILRDAYDETNDVFDLLDEAEKGIFKITEEKLSRGVESIGELGPKALKLLEEIKAKSGDGLTGVPTGFTELDKLTNGWQPSDLIILAARPGMGKCLGKGTPVIMYDGTVKAVEDVQVGDLLMGDDSTSRTVQSLARGREKMYWVRQTFGMDYRVNESHILTVRKSRADKLHEPRGTVTDIEVRDYLAKSNKWQNDHKGFKVPIEFDYQDVSVDPYILGLWLGDGKSENATIYTQDEEAVAAISAFAKTRGDNVSVTDQDRCPGYRVTRGYTGRARFDSFQTDLRNLGVLNNKHIPQEYLSNSRSIRLQMLAGLIDSDGHLNVGHGETYEIVQKSERLALQIKYLCDTLGYRTSIKEKIAKITSIGYECTVYRVRFNGDVDEIPVRIPRKQAQPWNSNQDWTNSTLTLEEDGVDDYYGFTIDGNRRFLLGDGTVTHNTAFVLSIARNAAMDFNKGVAIFSLEMANVQLVQRLLSMEAGVGGHQMRSGQLTDEEWDRLQQGIERLSAAPLFIDDTPAINIFELRAKCRRLKMQHDIQMIVIDYLQLMSGSAGGKSTNREQEISTISRNLKQLAKEINVPVIALSQLSRAVEQRGGDKRPMLSDLRESGAIEQDADMVNFIYRPEYYDITEDEDGNSMKGVAKIIIAKNRHGELKDVQLKWIANQAKFDNMDAVDFDSFRPGSSPFTSSGFGAEDESVTLQSRVNTDDEEIMF